MTDTGTLQGNKRTAWPVSVAVVIVCVLVALACMGGPIAAWGQQLRLLRPVVLHVGRFSLSADITPMPFCEPLFPSNACLLRPFFNRSRYFSVWVYFTPPQGAKRHISRWHLIALNLRPEEKPAQTAP